MRTYEEMVMRGVYRKYASQLPEYLSKQEPIKMAICPNVIQLPVTAEAKFIYEKEKPQIVVEIHSYNSTASLTVGARTVVSTRDIISANDTFGLADYVIERLREDLVRMFEKIRNNAKPGAAQ